MIFLFFRIPKVCLQKNNAKNCGRYKPRDPLSSSQGSLPLESWGECWPCHTFDLITYWNFISVDRNDRLYQIEMLIPSTKSMKICSRSSVSSSGSAIQPLQIFTQEHGSFPPNHFLANFLSWKTAPKVTLQRTFLLSNGHWPQEWDPWEFCCRHQCNPIEDGDMLECPSGPELQLKLYGQNTSYCIQQCSSW